MVVLALWQPSSAQVQGVTAAGERSPFNYACVGCTRELESDALQAPEGLLWRVDRTRCKLGTGKDTFQKAKTLLQRWRQFQLSWAQVDSQTPVKEGQGVAVTSKTLFLWNINPLRVIYVDTGDGARDQQPRLTGQSSPHQSWSPRPSKGLRWQFAHGCVEGHMLQGEEAFTLEWRPEDDSVWYEVLTVSRPTHPLAVVSYPLTLFFQKRFARESLAALADGLQDKAPPTLGTGW